MTALGKLLDKDALENEPGARGRMRISVPLSWAEDAALIEITTRRALVCARCDGGGCDGCERSGAIRAPASDAARKVRLRLPRDLRDGVAVRVARPFGNTSPVAQLWIEVRPAETPSESVRRLSREPRERRRMMPKLVAGLTLVVVLLATLLAVLTWTRG